MSASAPQPDPARASLDAAGSPGRAGSWGIIAALVCALLLRLWHLGLRSVWADEGSTWSAAHAPLRELLRLCAEKDASPPLFYLLTSAALRFGASEAHLRIVSALASVGLVWLTYRLARLGAPRGEAMLAAWIVALSPYQLMFAQEARTYTLVACLSVFSLYLFARNVFFGARHWPAFVVVSTLALYTQSIAVLGFGVQACFVLLTPEGRRCLRPWVVAMVVVALLYVPWLLVSIMQASHIGQSHWYIEAPTKHGVFQVLRAVFLSPISLVTSAPGAPWPGLEAVMPRRIAHVLLFVIPVLPLFAALPRLLGSGASARVARLALGGLVLPLVAVLVVSFRTPLWLPRYFVLLTPMLGLLTAAGLTSIRPRVLGRIWMVLLLVASAYACLRYDTDYTKERWREVAAHVNAERAPDRPEAGRRGTAVLVPFDVDPFLYYNAKLADPFAAFEVSHPEVPFADAFTPRQLDEVEAAARTRTRDFDEVWVLVRSANSDVRKEVAHRARLAAGTGREEVERRVWRASNGPVEAWRYRTARP